MTCRFYYEEEDKVGQCINKTGSFRVLCTGNTNEETCPIAIILIDEMEKTLGIKLRKSK
jgi:hypothetical protein